MGIGNRVSVRVWNGEPRVNVIMMQRFVLPGLPAWGPTVQISVEAMCSGARIAIGLPIQTRTVMMRHEGKGEGGAKGLAAAEKVSMPTHIQHNQKREREGEGKRGRTSPGREEGRGGGGGG